MDSSRPGYIYGRAAEVMARKTERIEELVRICEEKDAEIDRLQAIVAAQKELIWHYEDQADRSLFDDSDLPPELVKLEKAVEAAERKKPC